VNEFNNYTDFPVNLNNIVPDFVRRPSGFSLDISDFFLFDFPVTITIFLLGYLAFSLFFNYRISVLFRQYALLGYVLIILFDGKI